MAHRRSWDAEPAPDPSGAGGPVAAGGRRRAMPRPRWLLLALFVGLQIADIVTTNYALAVPRISEANPLVAAWQTDLGAAWWLPKAAVVAIVCAATPLIRRRWAMICVVALYAAAVAVNISHLC